MIQYIEKKSSPMRKRKKELMTDKSSGQNLNGNENKESFLICDDCRHNSITYEPSKDGACDCGCH
jgi:hypothetical protein